MASRFFAIGTLAVLTTVAAVAAVSTLRHTHLRPGATPGNARLHAFGSRSARQRRSAAGAKFDGALADLSRHAAMVRPDHAIEDLQSLGPAAKFVQPDPNAPPLVLIDAVTRGDPQQLQAALDGLGLQRASEYSNDVSGWLPVTALDAATARAEVHAIRAAMPRTHTAAVTSQGDFAQHSDLVRSNLAAPTLTLNASSIVVGSSTTITWSSANTTGCTASGSWSGARLASGSQTVMPTAAGTDTYSLSCANATGTSPLSSVRLTATAAPSGSGGGALDVLALLGLAGVGIARVLRLRARVLTWEPV